MAGAVLGSALQQLPCGDSTLAPALGCQWGSGWLCPLAAQGVKWWAWCRWPLLRGPCQLLRSEASAPRGRRAWLSSEPRAGFWASTPRTAGSLPTPTPDGARLHCLCAVVPATEPWAEGRPRGVGGWGWALGWPGAGLGGPPSDLASCFPPPPPPHPPAQVGASAPSHPALSRCSAHARRWRPAASRS